LAVTNAAGCSDQADVTISVDPAPALVADRVVTSCADVPLDPTSMYATNGLSMEWTLSGVPVAHPAGVYVTGYYQVGATNASGCNDTAVVDVTMNPGPSPGGDLAFALCSWQSINLNTMFPVLMFRMG
jgi:hypothetical protein